MTLIDHDLGTPAPRGASRDAHLPEVSLTIDGESVVVPEGTSVMRAAAIAGVDVLFISNSEAEQLEKLFAQLRTSPTLTVSDIDGFAKIGGMIGLGLWS